MSELRLKSLTLRNFKALRNYTFTPNGLDADVIAENGVGKTTLLDSFLWLLTGKNAAFKNDFNVKTLQPSGDSIHGFEHEAEGVFDLDGRDLRFKRSLTEKWTRQRGSATDTFTGHTTNFYVDDVPANEKEYKAKVAEMCDETRLRLLSDLTYFNQVMKWQDRRALLLEVCGDVSDADVIASDAALRDLPGILGERSIEDHKKYVAAQRTKINDELKALPVRIDEAQRSLPEVSGSADAVESDLKKLRAQAQEKHQERARITDGGDAAQKTKRLRELEAELLEHQNKARAEADEVNRATREKERARLNEIADIDREIEAKGRDIQGRQDAIQRHENAMDKLRTAWATIDSEIFERDMEEHDTTCYACGQELPAERIEEARRKALAAFNKDKAERLERNVEAGKASKDAAADLALANETDRKALDELKERRAQMDSGETKDAPLIEPDLSCPPLEAEIEAVRAEIAELGEDSTDALAALNDEIRELQEAIAEKDAALAAFAQQAQGKARIKELKAQEKDLAAEYERLEKELYLLEEFIRVKVSMLTDRINAKFTTARFKLFEIQINEGIKECCVTLLDGKPYPDLSTGEKIRISMDIISTLSEYFGFRAPIFMDHAESLTGEIAAPGQLIRLIAREDVKELRVETKDKIKEAI